MVNLIDRIEQKAEELAFSGVISIKNDNNDNYCRGFGYRDIKNRQSNNSETKFGIASGTKLFTALGIGKLIDSGHLSLTTTMEEIDKNFKGFVHSNATILHLLTHTSGIYDYYDEEQITDYDDNAVEIPWSDLVTPSDYLPLYEHERMKFSPGERYSYSNGGFVFLGIVIERITGRVYRDFLDESVLQSAGMPDSGFYAFDDLPENTANGYLKEGNVTNIYRLPKRGGSM